MEVIYTTTIKLTGNKIYNELLTAIIKRNNEFGITRFRLSEVDNEKVLIITSESDIKTAVSLRRFVNWYLRLLGCTEYKLDHDIKWEEKNIFHKYITLLFVTVYWMVSLYIYKKDNTTISWVDWRR